MFEDSYLDASWEDRYELLHDFQDEPRAEDKCEGNETGADEWPEGEYEDYWSESGDEEPESEDEDDPEEDGVYSGWGDEGGQYDDDPNPYEGNYSEE